MKKFQLWEDDDFDHDSEDEYLSPQYIVLFIMYLLEGLVFLYFAFTLYKYISRLKRLADPYTVATMLYISLAVIVKIGINLPIDISCYLDDEENKCFQAFHFS